MAFTTEIVRLGRCQRVYTLMSKGGLGVVKGWMGLDDQVRQGISVCDLLPYRIWFCGRIRHFELSNVP